MISGGPSNPINTPFLKISFGFKYPVLYAMDVGISDTGSNIPADGANAIIMAACLGIAGRRTKATGINMVTIADALMKFAISMAR